MKSEWTVIQRLNNKNMGKTAGQCVHVSISGGKKEIKFPDYKVSQPRFSFSSVSCGDHYHVIYVIAEDSKIVALRKNAVARHQ